MSCSDKSVTLAEENREILLFSLHSKLLELPSPIDYIVPCVIRPSFVHLLNAGFIKFFLDIENHFHEKSFTINIFNTFKQCFISSKTNGYTSCKF